MSKFGSLSFAPVAVAEAGDGERVIKVAVTKGRAIKLTFNAEAYAELGKPATVMVQAASDDRRHFLQLTPADAGGWPVAERDAPKGDRGRPSGSVSIKVHPFTPGVWHGAEIAEAEWLGGGVVIVAMPDWAAMQPEDATSEADDE